jgi:hypothetical protein
MCVAEPSEAAATDRSELFDSALEWHATAVPSANVIAESRQAVAENLVRPRMLSPWSHSCFNRLLYFFIIASS